MAFKRNLLLLGTFVLLGALTTFGIAWVSVLYVARAGWSDEAVEREWVGRWRRDEVDYVVCTMSQTGITQVTASRVCESRLSQEGFEKFYPRSISGCHDGHFHELPELRAFGQPARCI